MLVILAKAGIQKNFYLAGKSAVAEKLDSHFSPGQSAPDFREFFSTCL